MRKCFLILLLTCACINLHAQVNIITTICGNDTPGYSGDNGLAKKGELNVPDGVCLDRKGNLYIADAFNHAIRKINLASNIITTIAGNGIAGFSGDGGFATNSQLFVPEDVFTDNADNIYIADANNNRIRKITASTGIITTIAGSGPTGVNVSNATGDGGQATDAHLNNPSALCLDNNGNIYIADYGNNKIRKIDGVTGIITTAVGNGASVYSHDGLPGTAIGIAGPIEVFTDVIGNVFYCDQYNHSIRKLDASTGNITTVVGNGIAGYSGDNDQATEAQLNQPSCISVNEKGDLFIAQYFDGVIRKVDGKTNIITTIAGKVERGFSGDGGIATEAQLRCGNFVLDHHGTMYIADMDNNRIRMVRDTTQDYTAVQTVTKNDIKIYPNPASSELTVTSPDLSEGEEVLIYNLWGQKVISATTTKKHEVIMNVGTLPSGMYIIQIISPSGSKEVRRFVKE
ncbi:MAG: hypothetical protein JWQ38_2000 [Flavipsychrobacter sp.]|nr:hypothetical protein [Flavipsychrobacter sp.]